MSTEQLELTISRYFDAPRELVYKAFTDEDQIGKWFGPDGFSVPRDSISIDARTGGHQRFTMVNDADPDFTSPVDAMFSEVIDNELLVGYEHVSGIPGLDYAVRFTLTLEFFDEDGGTRLELRQGPYAAEMKDMARQGWMQSFEKLDALLAA